MQKQNQTWKKNYPLSIIILTIVFFYLSNILNNGILKQETIFQVITYYAGWKDYLICDCVYKNLKIDLLLLKRLSS